TWKYEFDKDKTLDDIFKLPNGNEVPCKMMIQKNDFAFYSNSDFKAVDLPYGDEHFSMTVILPNENSSTDKIIDQLSKENWNSWLDNFVETEGTIQLPKFKLEYKYTLNDVLKALGMEIAFDSGNADFTNLYKNGGVFISEVKHKSFVDVNEEGTEAAAVTAVEFGRTSTGSGFNMRIDRPFVFVIRESNSGSLLFMGKIIKPLLN
ncbi:MAG: serpin family protein, partial [Melioribacteraceae bacterium]